MNEVDEPALLPKIEAAFRQAARKVIRVAKQTGTPVIVWKDGRVQEIPCDQLDGLVPPEEADQSAPWNRSLSGGDRKP